MAARVTRPQRENGFVDGGRSRRGRCYTSAHAVQFARATVPENSGARGLSGFVQAMIRTGNCAKFLPAYEQSSGF